MRNFLIVARQEYLRIAGKRSFLLVTLAIPIGLALLFGVAIAIETSGESRLPIGYVDQAGFLEETRFAELPDTEDRNPVRAYTDEQAALAAVNHGEIQAVFVFPADYLQTLSVDLYYLKEPPSGDAWGDFDDFVRMNLLAAYPEEVRTRLFEGPEITVHDIASGRQFSEQGVVNIILPIIASFLFIFATMIASGYMLQAVTDEKENRMMEIMLTSLSPGQLIGGKAAGLLAVALTQLAIFLAVGVIGLLVAGQYVPALQQVEIPWGYLAIMVLFFLPSYALFAAIMVTVGSVVSEFQQGQQFAGLLNMVFMLPIFLLVFLFENPASPLFVLLTLFPPTAFLTVSLRWGLGSIPAWQMALSWILLTGSAIFMIWMAARIFRIGMLNYGQPLKWNTIVAALRES